MTVGKFADSAVAPLPQAPALRGGLREFVRYFACSAVALGVDAGLFVLILQIGLPYPVAGAVGFIAGLVVAYTLSVRYVFTHRRLRDERAEFVVFALVGVGGLVLTELLLWVMVGQAHWHPIVAKLITAGLVFCFNFGARKALLFTGRKA